MADMKEVCGVWGKEGRSGKFYSGKVKEDIVIPAGSYVNVFKNKDATEENRKPELRILFSEPEGYEPRQAQQPRREAPRSVGRDELDDTIPFAPCVEV